MSKNKLQVPVWLMAAGMAVTLVAGGGIGYAVHDMTNSVAETTASTTGSNKQLQQVISTYQTIENGYYKKVNTKKLAAGAIKGMLNSLDDPYSVYLTDNGKSSLDSTLNASFGGIGATVQKTDKKLEIASIMAGTPAKKSGLKVGDELTAINGKSVVGMTVDKAVAKIRGKIGTTVKITIKRNGKTQTFSLKRAKITTATVTSKLSKQDKTVGVITMTTFSEPTAAQFKQAIRKLRNEGAKSFVLDLRGNPGGMLDQAIAIASMCLKNGQTIVKVEDRAGNVESYKAGKKYDKGFKVTEPMAVLIDGDSASASEILSAALNEDRDAPLVGEQSYGKGTVQNVNELSSTAEVKLTVAKWLTPKGHWINKKGLTPTVKVNYPAYMNISGISVSSLKAGATGANVKSLQQVLQALGDYSGNITSTYDATTTAAVQKFQRVNKLTVTGTADSSTLNAMMVALATKFNADDPQMKAAVKLMTAAEK